MKIKKTTAMFAVWLFFLNVMCLSAAYAVTMSDDFRNGDSSQSLGWAPFGVACLTAGDNAKAWSIPACGSSDAQSNTQVGGYSSTSSSPALADTAGFGALRLTNDYGSENGTVISTVPFSSDQGLTVTFTADTYCVNHDGSCGADGMSFFLLDASQYKTNSTGPSTLASMAYANSSFGSFQGGSWGGSLGFSCSNSNANYQGIIGGYISLGIDEYGNFLNGGSSWSTATTTTSSGGRHPTYTTTTTSSVSSNNDNTSTGLDSNMVPTSNSSNVWTNPGNVSKGRVGLRGAGSISYPYLTAIYPSDYPSGLSSGGQTAAVQATCETGQLWNFSSYDSTGNVYVDTTTYPSAFSTYKASNGSTIPIGFDYPAIFGQQMSTAISNKIASSRKDANDITWKLTITGNGLLSLSYYVWPSITSGTSAGSNPVFTPLISNQSITATNLTPPSSYLFGFAGSTGGSHDIHEVQCFMAQPSDLSNTSAGANSNNASQQTGQAATNLYVYPAYYNSNNWWGDLQALQLTYNSSTTSVSVASSYSWDATCALSGYSSTGSSQNGLLPKNTCPTGSTVNGTPTYGNRVMFTQNGTAGTGTGMTFDATGNSSTNASYLTSSLGGGTNASNLLGYLRGNTALETTNTGGTLRARSSLLADIVDSSPVYVGAPSASYPARWTDYLYPGSTMPENTASYATYKNTTEANRQSVLYVGANDGFLHGFETTAGHEVMAYMPGAILSTINNSTTTANVTSPGYAHNYFVDATAGSGDLLVCSSSSSCSWQTWLVGGLGLGGQAIYALNVTDSKNFSEANANYTTGGNGVVVGEWTAANITCANVSGCGTNLGNVSGIPQIRRLHNGYWGAIFGNGLNSASGHAGIYIMLINPNSGAITFQYLDTGNATTGNGIVGVAATDLDGDKITDYVYAGDVKGNLWRFDLTSSNSTNWGVTNYSTGNVSTIGSPLFTTPAGQPITVAPVVDGASSAGSNQTRALVEFGTGQQTPASTTTGTTYATAQQALYGIWDWNMTAWNKISSTQYASLAAPQTLSTGTLTKQTFTQTFASTGNTETISNNSVCWVGSCSSGGTYGWYANLSVVGSGASAAYEQVIYNPVLALGAFLVNTTVPVSLASRCSAAPPTTGWTVALSPSTGGALSTGFFTASPTISGSQLGGTGTPSIFTISGSKPAYVYATQTAGNSVSAGVAANQSTAGAARRLNWRQIR